MSAGQSTVIKGGLLSRNTKMQTMYAYQDVHSINNKSDKVQACKYWSYIFIHCIASTQNEKYKYKIGKKKQFISCNNSINNNNNNKH